MKVQGRYLLSIPLNLTITLSGSDDIKTIYLGDQNESHLCTMLNSLNPFGVWVPKENNIYIKRARLESTLPKLWPGIGTDFDGMDNFAANISLRLKNENQLLSSGSVGQLIFLKYNEWYDVNDVIKAPEFATEKWKIIAGGKFRDGSDSYINYQDSNLNSFWNGKKGGVSLLLDIETAGLLNVHGEYV